MYLEVGVASCNAAVVDSSARGRDVGSTAVEERLEGTSAEDKDWHMKPNLREAFLHNLASKHEELALTFLNRKHQ